MKRKKILQIIDVPDWAIARLASQYKRMSPHFDWHTIYVHPKAVERNEVDLRMIEMQIDNADIIDAHYWRTLSQLAVKIPSLKEKVVILNHHNEKNIFAEDWSYVDLHIAHTKTSADALATKYPKEKIRIVYNSYDHREFSYAGDFEKEDRQAVGYVGRIVRWKGLKELAGVCYELGYPLMVMGKIDDRDYFEEIPQEHRDNIDWSFFNCPDEERANFYKYIKCYVGNSGSGRETGPLGLIEAMGSGVPVITTRSGIANDIGEHEKNCLLVGYDDPTALKDAVKRMMESPQLRDKVRSEAWNTIRGYNHDRAGLIYRNFLNELMYKETLVSVVIPYTSERIDSVHQILDSLEHQTYQDFEVVLVLDEMEEVPDIKNQRPFNRKWLTTGSSGYGLAQARNMGAIEADGEYLLFLDSRFVPDNQAIAKFKEMMDLQGDKVWLFGRKGVDKDSFVENFSMIRRSEYINAGMSCERITGYGGMSQELRERYSSQGFKFVYCPNINAEAITRTGKGAERREQIIDSKNLLYKMGL